MNSQPGLRSVGKAQGSPEPLRALVGIGDLPTRANRSADRVRIQARRSYTEKLATPRRQQPVAKTDSRCEIRRL
jgi:hypothetical protein